MGQTSDSEQPTPPLHTSGLINIMTVLIKI